MILLDCTLRDSGYYNDWYFSSKIVRDYLYKIFKSGIHIVELAFRFKNKKKFAEFSHLSESKIKKLNLPSNQDSTVLGISRGACSIKTEDLLCELKEFTNKKTKFNYEIIYRLIFDHFN